MSFTAGVFLVALFHDWVPHLLTICLLYTPCLPVCILCSGRCVLDVFLVLQNIQCREIYIQCRKTYIQCRKTYIQWRKSLTLWKPNFIIVKDSQEVDQITYFSSCSRKFMQRMVQFDITKIFHSLLRMYSQSGSLSMSSVWVALGIIVFASSPQLDNIVYLQIIPLLALSNCPSNEKQYTASRTCKARNTFYCDAHLRWLLRRMFRLTFQIPPIFDFPLTFTNGTCTFDDIAAGSCDCDQAPI